MTSLRKWLEDDVFEESFKYFTRLLKKRPPPIPNIGTTMRFTRYKKEEFNDEQTNNDKK